LKLCLLLLAGWILAAESDFPTFVFPLLLGPEFHSFHAGVCVCVK
jgi:hypothetical protein